MPTDGGFFSSGTFLVCLCSMLLQIGYVNFIIWIGMYPEWDNWTWILREHFESCLQIVGINRVLLTCYIESPAWANCKEGYYFMEGTKSLYKWLYKKKHGMTMINGLAYVYISMAFDSLVDLWSSLADANILFADNWVHLLQLFSMHVFFF